MSGWHVRDGPRSREPDPSEPQALGFTRLGKAGEPGILVSACDMIGRPV